TFLLKHGICARLQLLLQAFRGPATRGSPDWMERAWHWHLQRSKARGSDGSARDRSPVRLRLSQHKRLRATAWIFLARAGLVPTRSYRDSTGHLRPSSVARRSSDARARDGCVLTPLRSSHSCWCCQFVLEPDV